MSPEELEYILSNKESIPQVDYTQKTDAIQVKPSVSPNASMHFAPQAIKERQNAEALAPIKKKAISNYRTAQTAKGNYSSLYMSDEQIWNMMNDDIMQEWLNTKMAAQNPVIERGDHEKFTDAYREENAYYQQHAREYFDLAKTVNRWPILGNGEYLSTTRVDNNAARRAGRSFGIKAASTALAPLMAAELPGTAAGDFIGEMAGSTAMGEAADLTSRYITGRSLGENLRGGIEYVTGYNSDNPFYVAATDMVGNPFYAVNSEKAFYGLKNMVSPINKEYSSLVDRYGIEAANMYMSGKYNPGNPDKIVSDYYVPLNRGDLIEAERLRKAHFMQNFPDTKIVDESGNPVTIIPLSLRDSSSPDIRYNTLETWDPFTMLSAIHSNPEIMEQIEKQRFLADLEKSGIRLDDPDEIEYFLQSTDPQYPYSLTAFPESGSGVDRAFDYYQNKFGLDYLGEEGSRGVTIMPSSYFPNKNIAGQADINGNVHAPDDYIISTSNVGAEIDSSTVHEGLMHRVYNSIRDQKIGTYTPQHAKNEEFDLFTKYSPDVTYGDEYSVLADRLTKQAKVKVQDANSAEELHATLGEARAKFLNVEGTAEEQSRNLEQAVDAMSDEELVQNLKEINAYGESYADGLSRMGEKEKAKCVAQIRWLLKYAPASVGVTVGAAGMTAGASEPKKYALGGRINKFEEGGPGWWNTVKGWFNTADEYAQKADDAITTAALATGAATLAAPNPVTAGADLAVNWLGAAIDLYQVGSAVARGNYGDAATNVVELGAGIVGIKGAKKAIKATKRINKLEKEVRTANPLYTGVSGKVLANELKQEVKQSAKAGAKVSTGTAGFHIGVEGVKGDLPVQWNSNPTSWTDYITWGNKKEDEVKDKKENKNDNRQNNKVSGKSAKK